MDKSTWPRGEWDDEPDVLDWEINGLRCHIERMPWGNLNGYVGVPPGHELHGRYYSDDDQWPEEMPNVHGGLTYSGEWEGTDDYWWFGFDTTHAFDLQPNFPSIVSRGHTGTYRNLEYVKKEVEKLATYITLLSTGATELARIFNDSSS